MLVSSSSDDAPIPCLERWNFQICEGYLEELAVEDPIHLARMIRTGLVPENLLTFAAEHLGSTGDSDLVRSALLPLVGHPSPIVREGVLLGLQRHRNEKIDQILVFCASQDPSPGVRLTAVEALEVGMPGQR